MRFTLAAVILLACWAVPGRAAGNLVVNGDFETCAIGSSIPGWSPSYASDGSLLTVVSGVNNTPGGSCSASFGASGPDYDSISQVLTTNIGDSYSLQFYVFPGDDSADYGAFSFQQFLNGVQGVDTTSVAPLGLWSLFTTSFTGTGSDALMFRGYNAADYYYLDDVSVTDLSTNGGGCTADESDNCESDVPEPGTFGLLGCAFAVAAATSRRFLRA